MKKIFAAGALALFVTAGPALAKDFVQDQAGMLSSATVSDLNNRLSNFNQQTGKEVVVETVPSVAGADVKTAAENAFAQQQVNGVLIFVDKGDRKDYIVPDSSVVQAGWWSSETSQSIATAMEGQFRAGDFDGGITTAVNLVLNIYRSHLGSLQQNGSRRTSYGYAQPASSSAVHLSMFWIIIMVLIGFFVIRSLIRAASGPRYYGGGGYGPGMGPGMGPGYGPGYGGGYGWGGGGGGFFSGLLGGLGGAWLGNEIFGHQNYGGGNFGNVVDPNAGGGAPMDGGGWQADPGQADMGGGGGGDWGGGGFGGGDMGGGFGGGGDMGGGGGGGW